MALRRSARARRLSLSVDVRRGVELVIPTRASRNEALAFARSRTAWICARLDALPPRVPFAEGARVPLLGVPYTVRLCGQGDLFEGLDGRAGVEVRGRRLLVSATPDDASSRLGGWLRAHAAHEIGVRARRGAERIGCRISRLTLRDQRTRWGSCSAQGALSFSWRLVLAPEPVLDKLLAVRGKHPAAQHVQLRAEPPD